MLEVIDKGSVSDTHPVPLLFVHGAWHAAWCWDENFLSFFADKGYRALALSFRGHGDSPTDKPLRDLFGCRLCRGRLFRCRPSTQPTGDHRSLHGRSDRAEVPGVQSPLRPAVLMSSIPPQWKSGECACAG